MTVFGTKLLLGSCNRSIGYRLLLTMLSQLALHYGKRPPDGKETASEELFQCNANPYQSSSEWNNTRRSLNGTIHT